MGKWGWRFTMAMMIMMMMIMAHIFRLPPLKLATTIISSPSYLSFIRSFQHHRKRIISTNVNMTTFNTSESTPSCDHPHHQLQKQNDHRLWVVSRLPANHSPGAVPNLSARLTSYLSHPSLDHSFSFYRNRVWSLSLTNCAWGWWKSYLKSSWRCFLMLMKALTKV